MSYGEIDGVRVLQSYLSSQGLNYGPSFQGIEALRYNEREAPGEY